MTWREGEELREMVGRLRREKEAVRRNLEEAVKGKDKQAEEILEISNENKALSKWRLENMRGKRQLLEVKAGSETRITALQDALQKKESHLDTAKGEVLKLLEQLKAQEERAKGTQRERHGRRGGQRGSRASRSGKGKKVTLVGTGRCRESSWPPMVLQRSYRGWPARTETQGKKGCCRA